jgi:putative membrane protein insertion efficiency factor
LNRSVIHRLLHALPRGVLLFGIALYRSGISPLLGPSCRFVPSCSAYAEEAIRQNGSWRGGLQALRRLVRCHPFGSYGHDPVPTREER